MACIFCAIVAGEGPAELVDSDEHTVAFMDINPATPGHALVIPREHSADLLEISDADLERTMVAARRLAARMATTLDTAPDGFNVLNSCGVAAWQTRKAQDLVAWQELLESPTEMPMIESAGAESRREATLRYLITR